MIRRPSAVLAAVAALLAGSTCLSAQRAVFVVRHAERADQSRDAALAPAGVQRAERLAAMLRDAGVTTIFATEFQRAQRTAAPLAKRLGLQVQRIPRSSDDLVELLRAKHTNDIVLVVGHSNTVPEILEKLGYETKVTIADAEYDNLFFVVPGGGRPTVLRLRY